MALHSYLLSRSPSKASPASALVCDVAGKRIGRTPAHDRNWISENPVSSAMSQATTNGTALEVEGFLNETL